MSVHPTQLFTLLLAQNRIAELDAVLAKTEDRMKSNGERGMWSFWKGRAYIASGQIDMAKALLPHVDDPQLASALELELTKASAESSGDFQALIEMLEKRYSETGDALHLWELCELYHAQSNWGAIANRGLELVEKVGTPAALRLALIGSERTSDYRLCVTLLEQNAGLFPSGKLPADLRRLLVRGRMFEGMPAQALKEAEALAREFGETPDLLSVVSLRLASADPQGAVITSRELLTRSDVSPAEHLRLANILHAQDSSVAQAHLDKALSGAEHSPEFVSSALSLAFRFNREDIQRRLMPEFIASAEKYEGSEGPVRQLTLEETLQFFKESADARSQVESLYSQGQVPLHIAVERLAGVSLSQLYADRFHPLNPSLDRLPVSPVYIRHGGRSTVEVQRDIKRIYLDVSALLLSDELDILDSVISLFAPVYLPPSAIHFLGKQIDGTVHQQPSRLNEIESIHALLETRLLQVAPEPEGEPFQPGPGQPSPAWRELLSEARRNNGFLVDFLPLMAGIPSQAVILEPEETATVVGCASVLRALDQAGVLTTEECLYASTHLASSAQGEQVRDLPSGAALYLDGEIVMTLASAGILTAACKHFRVFIETREQRSVTHSLIYMAQMKRRGERLRALQGKVRTWLDQGKINLLPVRIIEEAKGEGLEMQCIVELIGAPNVPGSWVWIDDRFLNAHNVCGEVQIVTLFDILRELRLRGALSETDYFVKLHEVRAANLQYVPLSEEEILYRVRSANVQNDSPVETPELATLRRYFAACLFERGRLQLTPQQTIPVRPLGEMMFVMDSFNAIRDAIIGIWKDVANETEAARATAQSGWIFQNLWVEYTVVPWLMQQDVQVDAVARVTGSAIALLYFQGIRLTGEKRWKGPGLSPREHYFNWLYAASQSDLQTTKSIGKQLSEMFTQSGKDFPFKGHERTVMNLVMGDLLLSFPSNIRAAIHLTNNTWKRLGVRRHTSFHAGPWCFDGHKFCQSAARAVRGSAAEITSADGAKRFKMNHAVEADRFLLLLSSERGDEKFAVDDPIFSVLVRDPAKRRVFMRSHRDWFDCGQAILNHKTEQISLLRNDSERIRQLQQCRQGSAAFFYAHLEAHLESGEDILLSAFEPPSARGLLNHLRLSAPILEPEVPDTLRVSANTLLAEEGFEEAFRRLSTLPLPLPDEIHRAYAALSPEARRTWREQAALEFTAPVARLHFIVVVIRAEPKEVGSMFDELEKLAASDGEAVTTAFKALLHWVIGHLQTRADTATSSPTELLLMAWLHATRLYQLLALRSSTQIIKTYFDAAGRSRPRDLFRVERAVHDDVAHPAHIYHRPLMIHGISALLATATLDDAARERLSKVSKELCFTESENQTVAPDVHLLYDPRLRPNSISSYLQVEFGTAVASLLGLEAAESFSGDRLAEAANVSIEALRSKSDQPSHWALLQCVFGNVSPNKAGRENMRSLLLECSFVVLREMEPLMFRNTIFFIFQQAASFPNKEVLEYIEGQLVILVKAMSRSDKDPHSKREEAQILLECIRTLACVQSTETTAVREFARLVGILVATWPTLADEWWLMLRAFFTRIPAWYAVGLWPTILELRSKSQRIG